MINYPLEFNYRSESAEGVPEAWKTYAPEGREAVCAIPPEFEGPGKGYSPEDFFGLAVINCFVATFKVIAAISRVEYASLSVAGRLTVDRDEHGLPWMKAIQIEARAVSGPLGNPGRIERVLAKTSKSCIVANSIKTAVTFALEVVPE